MKKKTIESTSAVVLDVEVPYIPGFLAFRELPSLVAALNLLPVRPELVIVDGHGYAHPRRAGIATHLGVALDLPTIGVAKSRLVGREVSIKGRTYIVDNDEVLGCVVAKGKRRLYVSVGHKITLESALEIIGEILRPEHIDIIVEADRLSRRIARHGL